MNLCEYKTEEMKSRTAALRGRLHAALPLEGATRAPVIAEVVTYRPAKKGEAPSKTKEKQ